MGRLGRTLRAGEVREARGQGWQRRRLALAERRVQPRDLVEEQLQRPAVADDVVHHQAQDVLGGSQACHARADQRPGGQIERAVRPLGEVRGHLAGGQLGVLQGERRGGVDHLNRPAVPRGEARAEGLVPRHHLGQRPSEHPHVERAVQP